MSAEKLPRDLKEEKNSLECHKGNKVKSLKYFSSFFMNSVSDAVQETTVNHTFYSTWVWC